MTSKVAVITRTKNRPQFLERAIHSVAEQSFSDYVHVIVNDGGERAEFDRLIARMPKSTTERIRIFHRESSSNAPDIIFNESIDRVNSLFFAIHDDDDTWHPDFLEHTVQYLEKNAELAAVVVRTDKITERIAGQAIRTTKKKQWMPDLKVISLYRQCIDNQFTPIATLFRRDAYEAVGKFNDKLPVLGDWEFGVRLLQHYDAGFIDPGFALANYHHRKKLGTSQDSVSSDDRHRHYSNLVMNSYLRKELTQGYLGVGFIMSSIKYNQSYVSTLVNKMLPKKMVSRIKRTVRN